MVTAKDFAKTKATEIQQICCDIKCAENKELRIFGIEKIYKLAEGILEHLEYLEIKEDEENKE